MSLATRALSRARRFVRTPHRAYYRARKKPVMARTCLFEAGQGKNLNGNMFCLLRELKWNPEFEGFEATFVTREENDEQARAKLALYGIKAATVIRGSDDYEHALARCEFLFTDNSFPPYFEKRSDQVYVNTWHGTPLKRLGHSNIRNSIVSISNVQKNFLTADCVLFPNELTRSCFFDDYKLAPMFSNRYVFADYPRNDALSDDAIRQVVRDEEGLEGKRVIAYMPTWRGTSRSASVLKQTEDLYRVLSELDGLLGSGELVYVNLHFLLDCSIDYSGFEHIRRFPERYETYDFLSACDVLVTDYSSVFFDFAVTGRKIVLFPYDRDEYLENVGTYLPYGDLPFPVALSAGELADLVTERAREPYAGFQQRYCRYHTGHAARDLLATVCLGKDVLELRENDRYRPVRAWFVDRFTRPRVNEMLLDEMSRNWPEDGLLVFMGGSYARSAEFLEQLPDGVFYLSITTYRHLPLGSKVLNALVRRSEHAARAFGSALADPLAHELHRLMPGVRFSSISLLEPLGGQFSYMLGSAHCGKVAYVRDLEHLRPVRRRRLRSLAIVGGYEMREALDLDPARYSEDARIRYYSEHMRADLLIRRSANTEDAVGLAGVLAVRCVHDASAQDFSIELVDGLPIGKMRPLVRWGDSWLFSYRLSVPKEQAPNLPTQSAVMLKYEAENGLSGRVRLDYMPVNLHLSPRRRSRPLLDEEASTALFFRHSAKNYLYLTIRQINPSDYPEGMRLINRAYWLAKVRPYRDAVVLYEKLSSRYEESASVVYEKLVDAGYDNVRFILDDGYRYRDEIPEKYRAGIVSKNSLEHYRLFFSAKTFIGSEMLPHSIELGSSSDKVAARLADRKLNYVFLQHGVMYMVSLDSESRSFFKPRSTTTGKYRVVTSSENEKRHFTERAGYDDEMVYVCGLPKYDRNTWSPSADRIVVMPTWRPWETNAARIDFRSTGYYRFLERIMGAIPPELADKAVILPHPLFQQHAAGAEFPLKRSMDAESRYDDVLREAKLLVTDYSSIAYDAFYRGANIVFFWADKDECMAAYGERTTLMIEESTAFGDVCYADDELADAIARAYVEPQSPEYVRRYRQIVQFHDGKNTERLIELLHEDGIA